MAKIWLTSDTHFAHANSLRYCGRPFFTATQCDETIVARWNALVAPEDTVYHLGDVAMHTKPMMRLISRLNGNKVLIVGNHDLMYSYFIKTRGQKFVDKMLEDYKKAGFSKIYHGSILIAGARLCHFPTKNAYDSYHNDKHDHARPTDNGIPNICGHVHDNWLKRGNNINVGVDVTNFKPVLLEDILDLYYNGPENIEAPYKIRRYLWKTYHTLVWKLSKLLKNK